MSLTLGEKLRQTREEKGISVGEVAENTRISPIYIESIDNDDYRVLPGGIFNRGFIKSYAKYVGIDEQEALADYARLLNDTEGNDVEIVTTYKPEVLTDDRTTTSMVPTIIVAMILLGLMTGGVLFLVNYFRQPAEPVAENKALKTNNNSTNATAAVETEPPVQATTPAVPDMANLRVEFKAISQPVSLMVTSDGKTSNNVITPGSTTVFEPKENVKFSYSRSLAQFVQLNLNGKSISLPTVPLNPKRANIEFEINKDNLAQIWTSGAISTDVPVAVPSASIASIEPTGIQSTTASPRPSTPPKPSIAPNTAVKPSFENKPVNTPRTVIIVGKPTPTKQR